MRGIKIFSIGGIDIRLDYSWFIIFFLVLWALTFGYFPYNFPGYRASSYWMAGITATLLLFVSILAHELMHSLVAIRSGIKIPDITLFIFGGVSRISREAKNPWTELNIAAAGPLSSFALAVVFLLIRTFLVNGGSELIPAVFGYLGWINILLGIFNLIPAFPLDGGRVFRALWWIKTGSLTRATRVASDLGKGFAWALMLVGAFQIFTGALLGGIWLIFIGMFMRGIAERGYQELILRQSLEGMHVEEVMMRDVVSVPADTAISRLVNDYFFKYCFRSFPVVKGGDVAGTVSLNDVASIPDEERQRLAVETIMKPLSPETTISPRSSLADALGKMNANRNERLIVRENGKMEGMLTKAGLIRFLQIKQVLKTA